MYSSRGFPLSVWFSCFNFKLRPTFNWYTLHLYILGINYDVVRVQQEYNVTRLLYLRYRWNSKEPDLSPFVLLQLRMSCGKTLEFVSSHPSVRDSQKVIAEKWPRSASAVAGLGISICKPLLFTLLLLVYRLWTWVFWSDRSLIGLAFAYDEIFPLDRGGGSYKFAVE
jgi:hypothetical protein